MAELTLDLRTRCQLDIKVWRLCYRLDCRARKAVEKLSFHGEKLNMRVGDQRTSGENEGGV